jgi:hypothetical protein
MRVGYAEQWSTASVIVEEGDRDADAIVEMAEENDAFHTADERYLVIRFPGRSDECYTEDALRRSIRQLAKNDAE